MKKIILALALAFATALSASALDGTVIKKACESFFLDKNAVALKGEILAGSDSGNMYLKADCIKEMSFGPAQLGIGLSKDVDGDLGRMFKEIPYAAISSATYANGVLSLKLDISKLRK